MERSPELAIVGDDEEAGCTAGTGGRPRLVDQPEQDVVGRSASGVADDESRGDTLAAKAGLRRAVEHELDPDRRRDCRSEATDQRGLRGRTGSTGERVKQVRSIDDQPIGR
jgi:hypothetical protein